MAVYSSLSPLPGRYMKGKLLGEGTFGTAWLSSDGLGEKLVVKEVPLQDMTTKQKDMATQEVEILRKLSHPNIIGFRTSYFSDDNLTLTIVMEFAEKGDLQGRIKKQKGVSYFAEKKILEWLVQILFALQYIHRQGILHRDLKTQNIFVSADDTLKLGDFGIAFIVRQEVNNGCALSNVGTPFYMSPEIVQNQPYDEKSDMFSAGCCLYEICCLRVPFPGTIVLQVMNKITLGQYAPLPGRYSRVLITLVQQLLSKLPRSRPSSTKLLGSHDLQPYVAEWKRKFELSATIDLPSVQNCPPPSRMNRPLVAARRLSVLVENSPAPADNTMVLPGPSRPIPLRGLQLDVPSTPTVENRRKSLIPVAVGSAKRGSPRAVLPPTAGPSTGCKRKSDSFSAANQLSSKRFRNDVETAAAARPLLPSKLPERRRSSMLSRRLSTANGNRRSLDRQPVRPANSPIVHLSPARNRNGFENIMEEELELSHTFLALEDISDELTETQTIQGGSNPPIPTSFSGIMTYLHKLFSGKISKEDSREHFAQHFGSAPLEHIAMLVRAERTDELREFVGIVNTHLIAALMFVFCE